MPTYCEKISQIQIGGLQPCDDLTWNGPKHDVGLVWSWSDYANTSYTNKQFSFLLKPIINLRNECHLNVYDQKLELFQLIM